MLIFFVKRQFDYSENDYLTATLTFWNSFFKHFPKKVALQIFSPQELQGFTVSHLEPCKMQVFIPLQKLKSFLVTLKSIHPQKV